MASSPQQEKPAESKLTKDEIFEILANSAKFLTFSSSEVKIPRLYDVTTITESPALFKRAISFLSHRYKGMQERGPTHILAIESRGFIIGAPLAYELGIPFIPMQVENLSATSYVGDGDIAPPTLPMTVRNQSINESSRVVIVDDIISTGKTMASAIDCVNIVGASIVEIVAICDMLEGGGMEFLRKKTSNKVKIFTFFQLRNSLEFLSHKRLKSMI